MAWTKKENVAMYQGADWNTCVKLVTNSNPEEAQLIADRYPDISFFFICNAGIDLGDKGQFNTGDALFFTGKPWYGEAPQCDAYEKIIK